MEFPGGAEAGPSRLPHPAHSPSHTVIPAYGIELFEYRRRLFLSGQPLPPNPRTHLPESYTVPLPFPEPKPLPPNDPSPTSGSVGKLEALLQEDGAEETMAAWRGGLAGVHARLDGGKKLSRPLKLGLVIRVLKAGWIQDGTWPTDPNTRRAARPPSSPSLAAHKPQASRRVAPGPPTTSSASVLPPTPLPILKGLPLPGDPPVPDLVPPSRSASLMGGQRQHDPELDLKVGGDVWRGAKRDTDIIGGTAADHG
ncbi:uncharacterized protein MKK02DRAFT_40057 [Dioszegia hungarica]|uniref:Uncharacterized protein n=1 Tax=Dioszegia hungarica TaxID=4972 RepID=A0AA38LXH0_9TREE|nr:uncharacterized protein MKK02DRAFT_40057 [Dioszegia hungarica]KAI9639732.1 hypothetical protein MKK02DRAFT_40057 [Dioszegia hungarica]